MKRLVSGIKPTGDITLGNYIGAIKQFIELQDEYEMFIFIADLHAITTPQDKLALRKSIKNLTALYLACGLNPDKVNIFMQSEIPAHPMLGYVMECTGHVGEYERMTQYKDKRQKQESNISLGMLTYPALMAADILLYDAEFVPVGADQQQHLEMTRDLATRFNNRHGETFVIPQALIPKKGAKIMDLQYPEKKMSKSSDTEKGYILLLDDVNRIKNKIKSAITDSDTSVRYDKENKPGVSNLMTIYSSITNLEYDEIEAKYKDMGYKEFKEDLANIVGDFVSDIQAKHKEIINSNLIDEVLDKGYERASKIAMKKVYKVYNKLGLGRKRK